MNIKQILKAFHEYGNKNESLILNEFADKNRCGLEVSHENIRRMGINISDDIPLEMTKQKLNWMIQYIETTDKKDLKGFKVSTVRTINFFNEQKLKTIPYQLSICIGDTDENNNIVFSKHGLYHMLYGHHQHWERSKECLNNIDDLIKGHIRYLRKKQGKFSIQILDYVNISLNHHKYGIGLAGNPVKNETVLITCFTI